MALKAVLFDLDGTLLDTAPDFVTVLNRLREEEGLPPLPDDAIRRSVSNGARALIDLSFKLQRETPDFDRMLNRLLALYSENLAVKTGLFAGMERVLHFIEQNHLTWGIVTNKSSLYTLPILEALNLVPAPVAVICPDHVSKTKPDPEPLLLACQQMGCLPGETIYVGDHLRDIDCGRNAGVPTVAAAYGYIAEDDDAAAWRADYIVQQADELIDILNTHL